MLHIYFKRLDDFDTILTEDTYRICPTRWFNHQGGINYVSGELEQQIIKDIDKAVAIAPGVFKNDLSQIFTAGDLSGTSKALILANNEPGIYVNGDYLGENGYPWLLKMAEDKDIYLRAGNIMLFRTDFPAHIINDDSYITVWREFVEKGVKFAK